MANRTVFPVDEFNPEEDAQILRKAMKGWGTSESPIIDIIVNRSWEQLKEVEAIFKTAYGRDLKEDLEEELRGDFQDVVVARFLSPAELDAWYVRKAMKGSGTQETILIQVICTKTNEEIDALKNAYKDKFERDLVEDIQGEATGAFEELLVALLQGGREEEKEACHSRAMEEAQEILDAGENRFGTDESVFNRIFVLRSYDQLREIFSAYDEVAGNDIEDAIDEEMSDDMKDAFLTLIHYIQDPIIYYAKSLRKAMEGVGTNDLLLQRIILSRCEIDLEAIKDKYKTLYADVGEGDLDHWLKHDTSGDYEKILRMLCKGVTAE